MEIFGIPGEESRTDIGNRQHQILISRVSKVWVRPLNLKPEKTGRAETPGKAEDQSQGNFNDRNCLFLFFPGKSFPCGRILYGIF
jgi:hypothetical protein